MREELRESSHYPDRASTCRKSRFGFRARLAAAEKFRKSIGGQPVLDKCLRGVRHLAQAIVIQKSPRSRVFWYLCEAKDNRIEHFPDGLLRHKIVTAIART